MDKIDKYRWRWCKSIGKRSNGLDWRGRGDSRSGRLRQRFGTCGVGVGVDERLSVLKVTIGVGFILVR
jgi:hypothetical protein